MTFLKEQIPIRVEFQLATPLNAVKYNEIRIDDGLVQNCTSVSASPMEILQSCTKPSKYTFPFVT